MVGKLIKLFFFSMIPLIELRGAIPIGLSEAWGPACQSWQEILILYCMCNSKYVTCSIYFLLCKKST